MDKLVNVQIVPDMRSLDYFLLKKKEYQHRIGVYKKRRDIYNQKYILSVSVHGIKEKVDAVEFFER